MAFVQVKCKTCGNKKIKSDTRLGQWNITIFECNHSQYEKIIDTTGEINNDPSIDGKVMFPFQVEGVKFALESNANCLIADEMGLGKTVQALKTLRSRPTELLPAAVFCKSKMKFQWSVEGLRWMGHEYMPQIVNSTKEPLLPGFKLYIFSLDLLRRRPNLPEELKALKVKTIIIDEVQHIKDHQSQRAIAVRKICQEIPHKIALSGTPIKNRATEYFSILNILKPEIFKVYEQFCRWYCDAYTDSRGYPKWGGLRYPEEFFEMTKSFIIRREWDQVFKEFPKINRVYKYDNLSDDVEKAYQDLVDEFADYYNGSAAEPAFSRHSNIMAYLAKMRHLVGDSKIDPCIDYVMDFLLDTERQIAIFVHHKDVHQVLMSKLLDSMKQAGLKPDIVSLEAALPDHIVEERKAKFMNKESRVLIASTLAYGEGLNLQSCSDWIIMERQWNPANEEQAERRFARLGQEGRVLNSVYFVAVGTVDEYLAEIVERKRGIFAKTMSGKDIEWNKSEIIQELAEKLASLGRRKWSF